MKPKSPPPDPIRTARRRLVALTWILAFIFLVSVVSLYLVISRRSENSRDEQFAAAGASRRIETILDAQRLAETMARSAVCREALSRKETRDPRDLMLILDAIGDATSAEIAYVLDHRGVVIASRPVGVPSITGNNYAFRPYFTRAMEGQTVIFPAVGVSTLTRGIYVSSPVPGGDGVAVIKFDPNILERMASNYEDVHGGFGLLVSPEGVVFAATRPEWRLRALAPLDGSVRMKLKASRQFGSEEIFAGPHAMVRKGAFLRDGVPWVAFEHPMWNGWSWVSAYPRHLLPPLDLDSRNFFIALTISGALTYVVIWLLLFYSYRIRRADALARQTELELRGRLTTLVDERTAELTRANAELKREAEERQAAEARKREMETTLHQAEKMQAIGQLAGGIAHDFNNQLAAMMGYADLIRSAPLGDPRISGWTEKIILAARTSADLTSRLLSFARREPFVAEPCDLHGILDETIALLRHAIDRRISVTLESTQEPLMVSGNRAQLENVLLNLGLNARDAIPQEGRIRFRTRIARRDEEAEPIRGQSLPPGDYLVVEVADTGVGMDETILRRLFEPFFTTKPVGRGTGLGLATVFSTVKTHGGAVGVHSTPGVGSTFEIWLPRLSTTPEHPAKSDKPTLPPASGPRGRVLVADDESSVRDLLVAILQQEGFEVLQAEDGQAAVDLFQKEAGRFKLVFMDMVMPRMSGREAMIALRNLNPGLPIVLASGYMPEGTTGDIPGHGPLLLLQKPFSMMAVRETLAKVLGA